MTDNAWVRCAEHGMELAAAPYPEDQDHEAVGHVAGVAGQHRERWPDHTLEFGREPTDETAIWDDLAALQEEDRAVRQKALIEEHERLKIEREERRLRVERAQTAAPARRVTQNGFIV